MTNYDPGEHTAVEVRAYVADHPDEAAAVLAAEQAGKNRSTLVADLSSASEPEVEPQKRPGGTEGGDGEEGEDGEAPAKPEDETIYPPGEYPDEGTFGYSEKSMVDPADEAAPH